MSTSIQPRATQSATPAPIRRDANGRAVRLQSTRNRDTTPFRLDPAIVAPRAGAERQKPQCQNKLCPQSNVIEDDGKLICQNCGYVLQESQITQELTFGEASNGAAIVQGAFVGENDAVARNPAMAGNRMGGGMTSREQTERNGSHFMNSLVQALKLQQIDKDRGMRYFKLAAGNNFIQGRITRYVAAVCLYVACRGERDCKVMLIDFSDILEVNVFKLGQIFNDLVETLSLQGSVDKRSLFECNPENLIQRFAQDLEFGPDEHRIANEAVQILKRMKRDWIFTGRRPAGVCGAALILAARMNNYRRTVREVVYTAKVADVTINKRLEEFKFTDSSQLTVDEFRHHGVDLEKEHDPPAYYRQFQKKKQRKRSKKVADTIVAEDAVANDNTEDEEEDDEMSDAPSTALEDDSEGSDREAQALIKEQADQRAMPPPAIPIDPQLQEISNAGTPQPSRKRLSVSQENAQPAGPPAKRSKAGRPPGARNKPLPVKTAAAIADEEVIENEILEALADPDNQAEAQNYHQSILPTPPQTQQKSASQVIATTDKNKAVAFAKGLAVLDANTPRRPLDLDAVTIGSDEFEDDPEVRDCLLPESDRAIKEAVWVTNNGNWLKEQQARRIKRELAERSGTAKVPQKRKRHRGRLGDLTPYETQNEDGTVSRPTTSDEATIMMLAKRGYSKKLNYDAVRIAYGKSPSEASGSPETELVAFTSGKPKKRAKAASPTPAQQAAERIKARMDQDDDTPAQSVEADKARKAKSNSPVVTRQTAQQDKDSYKKERSELDALAKEAKASNEDDEDDEVDEDEEDEEEAQDDWQKEFDEGDNDNFSDYGEEYD